MMPVIYTTYGMAMRHHPEVLAASGGLGSAGAERIRECPTRVHVARAYCWFSTLFALVRLRPWNAGRRMARAERLRIAALPSNQ
jgi:hypothetical protein